MTKKALLVYLLVSFLFSWSLAGVFYILGGRLNSPYAGPVFILYMFGPLLGAVVAQKLVLKSSVLKPLAVSFKLNRWYLFAWFLPPVLAFAALGVSLLFSGVSFSPEMTGMFARYQALMTPEQFQQMQNQVNNLPIHPIWLMLAQGLIAGATINALAAFGEELGWRGLMYQELISLGFWRSSIIIGTIWGIWHAPIIIQGYNYPQHPGLGVLLMILWCILLAPLFSFARQQTKSVVGASLIHGTLNGTAALAVVLVQGGNDLTTGLLGFPGIIVLILANLAIYLYQQIRTPDSIKEHRQLPHNQ